MPSPVGQIVPPDQCDENGDPLDWKRCRTCGGEGNLWGKPAHPTGQIVPCPTCDGHGSLEAAALAHHIAVFNRDAQMVGGTYTPRCEDCNHPMSEGTWEDADQRNFAPEDRRFQRLALNQPHGQVAAWAYHFSPCDEKCTHGGPGQANGGAAHWDANRTAAQMLQRTGILTVEASWRPVAVRTGIPAPPGHPHPMLYTRPFDLRMENLRVLCLRCWAARA